MSNFDKKIIDKYWLAVSDLTIFEAAFWMYVGSDPLNHERIYDIYMDNISERNIGEGICNRIPEWADSVHEKCNIIASAIRAGSIRVTVEKGPYDPYVGHTPEFKAIHINKYDWLDWCRSIGYSSLADQFNQTAPVGSVNISQPSPGAQTRVKHKLRRNNLDPAIDKAIKQAESHELADVYLKLKALAIDEEKPFTGALDGDALCYTDDNNQPAKLPKEALGKRLKRR